MLPACDTFTAVGLDSLVFPLAILSPFYSFLQRVRIARNADRCNS